MQITDVKAFLVQDRARTERNYAFVKIYTDEGLSGLGEAGINGKELALKGLIDTYAPILRGMDPSRIEHIWQTLWRGQFFRGGHVHAAAVAAIDIALWDLRGKALGVPVYDLLGGRTRDYARCSATCSRPTARAATGGRPLTRWPATPASRWRRGGGSSDSALATAATRNTMACTSSRGRCAGQWRRSPHCARRSVLRWRSASISTSVRRLHTRSSWRGN